MNRLKVPNPFSRGCVQRQNAIGKEIGPLPVATPEIERRRAGGQKHQTPLLVHRDSAPGIRATGPLPGIRGPGVVAVFARMRDGVEDPTHLARTDVVGSDVTGCRWPRTFGNRRPKNQKVAINCPRSTRVHEEMPGRPPQSITEIDRSVLAKIGNRFPGLGIQRIKFWSDREQNPFIA